MCRGGRVCADATSQRQRDIAAKFLSSPTERERERETLGREGDGNHKNTGEDKSSMFGEGRAFVVQQDVRKVCKGIKHEYVSSFGVGLREGLWSGHLCVRGWLCVQGESVYVCTTEQRCECALVSPLSSARVPPPDKWHKQD